MKRLVCLLMIALLIVAGCAKKDEEKKAVCRITEDGISDEMTIEALNDTVMRSKSVMKLPFSLYGLTTDDEKAQFAEQMMAEFTEVAGIKITSESTADEFILTLEIDYSTVAFESLLQLGMMNESDMDVEIISFEKTVEELNASGYTCE
jgi:uncharacterized lipoprotein YehR (DUF1307 family)